MKEKPVPFALTTFTANCDQPTLAEAAAALGIQEVDCDPCFGVVVIDPAIRLFSVMARNVHPGTPGSEPFSGPFSNPTIGIN